MSAASPVTVLVAAEFEFEEPELDDAPELGVEPAPGAAPALPVDWDCD
ncbi:hypothetical protein ACFQ9X_13345 [Catenulispora yoronensis]